MRQRFGISSLRGYATKLVWLSHNKGAPDSSNINAIFASKSISSSLAEGIALFDSPESLSKFKENSKDLGNHLRKIHYSISGEGQSLPEPLSESLSSLISRLGDVTHFIASNSSITRSFVPRLAAMIDIAPVTDVIKIESDNVFVRPIFAGNAFCKVRSLDPIKLITIRSSSFPGVDEEKNATFSPPEYVDHENLLKSKDFRSVLLSKKSNCDPASKKRPELADAKIVVSGGRALGSAQLFQEVIFELADALGGAIGASRAAVDSGFIANEHQVGQTGKIVAPDLYIAVGISGAIQHVAGMKDSKVIVSINKDPEASIFSISDYWLVGDIFKLVPELSASIRAKSGPK
ncbi:hypothetical protein MDAP_002278 [Mitosporidium daphniae]